MLALLLHLLLSVLCGGVPLQDSSLGHLEGVIVSEVSYQPERSQVFLGSPSILALKDGSLLITADRFGSGFHTRRNTSVHVSRDGGFVWKETGWVLDQYWSNLFQLDSSSNDVWLLGTATDGPAPIKIARSRYL